MTPTIDTFPGIISSALTMSAPSTSSPTAFTSLVLGRSANAIELLVPPAPAVHAATDLKARCFDFLTDLLVEHSALYSSAELIAAFGHIPSSSYNAALEAAEICKSIRSSFFSIDHLQPLGFRDNLGAHVYKAITTDLTQRPAGLSYFAFRSTVNPTSIDPRLTSMPSFSFEFWLSLPQTILTPSNGPAASSTPQSVAKVLQFGTPTKPTNPVMSKDDFIALSPAAKSALATATTTDLVSDYAPEILPLFTPVQLQFIVLRTADAAAAAPSASLLSPRMSAVLASSTASRSSYFGSLDFLDCQATFDSTFPKPVPLLVTISSNGVSLDSLSLSVSLNKFIDHCKFHLFVPIFRSDYVGTFIRDDAASLHATLQALKKPAMSYRHSTSGHWINLTPDELFAAYTDLTPLLPTQISLWGLNLVTQFFDALSSDLQESIHTDPLYSSPDLSTLTSRSTQLDALRSLRVAAVRNHTILRNQEKLIAKTVLRKLKHGHTTALAAPLSVAPAAPPPPPASPISDPAPAPIRTLMSPAEQTMNRYQPTPASSPATFPIDPVTNFQSPYAVGFHGCMFCGSTDHVFRSCPQHEAPGASSVFFKNLFAHKPHLRKKEPRPDEYLPAPFVSGTPATQSFSVTAPPPAAPIGFPPPGQPPANPSALSPPPPSPVKKARFMLMLAKTFSAHTSEPRIVLPPMPIAIDNGLPHIAFNLGSDHALDPSLVGLMDTCGALNTGYLLFHLWLKSERPDLVAEFISFDDTNPFEPIKLGGAISDPSNFDASDHGNLTAVIRYYTPYTDPSGSPITISFALGADVTVNTIFGLPMLCDLDAVISLRTNSMHSRALNLDFPITRSSATFGLPADCLFDPADSARNHASSCGLPSSATTSALPIGPPSAPSASATDDMSLGFLQRTVHPSP
jgi:hypothetical protein